MYRPYKHLYKVLNFQILWFDSVRKILTIRTNCSQYLLFLFLFFHFSFLSADEYDCEVREGGWTFLFTNTQSKFRFLFYSFLLFYSLRHWSKKAKWCFENPEPNFSEAHSRRGLNSGTLNIKSGKLPNNTRKFLSPFLNFKVHNLRGEIPVCHSYQFLSTILGIL